MSKKRVEAVAYLRTSSPTNVGRDKDSDKRPRDAIHAFAKRAGHVNERGRPFHHKSMRAKLDD